MKEYSWDTIMGVEDALQDAKVFVSGINGRTCHSDSYMTVVDFAALDTWMRARAFDKPTLEYCINYWLTNENMQPPLKLAALSIKRFIDKPSLSS